MRFLFTTFEGGGHVPPAVVVARQLLARGHDVLFVSDEATRAEAIQAGLRFRTWKRAPNRHALAESRDPLDDWRRRWPPRVVKAVCDAVMCRPAADYAADTIELIQDFRPNAVISNELLFGTMAATERTGVPLALLTANVWCFPTRNDVPPFGPGFAPGDTAIAHHRDKATRRMISAWYDVGLSELNAARASLRLSPLARTLDQLRVPSLIMLGTSASFDFGHAPAPAPFAYAGPLGFAPSWAAVPATGLIDPDRPNVLVSFSTTYQGQERAIARCIRALSELPVSGVVTLGPAIRIDQVPSAPNVRVVARASHDTLVPHCRAVVCHGGHGTVLRPLMHGVPVICLPMGRDHPDNAQRVASRGAGVRLVRHAGIRRIRRAIRDVLNNPEYARRARELGAAIRKDLDGGKRAAIAFERLAAQPTELHAVARPPSRK